MTKSQFKFYSQYSDYNTWLDAFNTELYGYKRTFNISKWSENPKHSSDECVLSYQPFQTLELSQEKVKTLCTKTIEIYKSIKTDVNNFLEYRGLINKNIDNETGEEAGSEQFVPPYYEALKVNKELFKDNWIQSKIKDDLDGFKKRCCKGMIFTKASYQTLIPDLVAFAEYAFNLPVLGILSKNEVYSNFWYDKKVERLGIVRFPHIAREWKVVNVVYPEDENTKYFSHTQEGYVINIWDSTALRLGTADFDGDHVYGIADETILSVLKEQESNTIMYVSPEQQIQEKKSFLINDMAKLIETDCNGMESNIGNCINKITTLWSLEHTEEVMNYIKIMSVVGAKIIDFAKSGIAANTPEEIEIFLKNKKLPYFMRYKYPSIIRIQNRTNRNQNIKKLPEVEKLNNNDCTMNRICKQMEEQLSKIDKDFEKEVEKFEDDLDWWKLVKDKTNEYSETFKRVKKEMIKLNTQHKQLAQARTFCTRPEDIKDNGWQYKILYDYAYNSLLSVCYEHDIDKLLDCMLIISYTEKNFFDKAILWNSFSKEMLSRVKGEYYIPDKPFDVEKLHAKSKKLRMQLIKKKKSDKKVKTILKLDREIKDENGKVIKIEKTKIDTNKIKVGISMDEITYIKEREDINCKQKHLAFVLLVLNKMHYLEGCKFRICGGKKDKITPSHISKLANIDIRQYDLLMTELFSKGLFTSPTGLVNLLCNIPFANLESEEEPVFIITNINDVKKYFKNIAILPKCIDKQG